MSDAGTHTYRALEVARDRGIARARDFEAAGIPLAYIRRLCNDGRLIQLGRGLYQLPDLVGADAEHDLAEAVRLVPHGVVCLFSALRHHGLTTQLPQAVWLAIPHKARAPKTSHLTLEFVRASEPAYSAGVERVVIEGVETPIYGAAKTVADCFKYRRRVGLDVAVEALRDALRLRIATVSELAHFAGIDRVANVMRPYLEALA
ncbi:MAG: type IV toxin-antitoxin system AbiEi family antitoxin domain-containing protein [Pseudomonadota bacterium]